MAHQPSKGLLEEDSDRYKERQVPEYVETKDFQDPTRQLAFIRKPIYSSTM